MPAAASSSAPAATPAAALLAPGFRFHPTDEELVSYYLRRRVCGRALRVDAIAEVELYKCEPWELPGLSRLRSRDLEWYFFSPLDRKYSSRSRTNRATAQGYWKTTGKDRDVSCGARVVGMKKTLVYHSGRAPRGTRTNWVMHEYRLEDSQLAKSGTPQDAYVVCRVFQKNGAGPQNGAQYGAPFVEEEWEEQETANGVVLMPEAEDDDAVDAHDQEYLEFNDLLQDQIEQEMFVQQDSAVLDTNRQGNDNDPENPTIVLDEILKDPSFMDDVFAYINQSKVQSGPTIVDDSGEQILWKNLSHNDPSQTNDFVELNDSENAINKNWNSNKRYANFVTGEGENSQLYKRIEAELLDSAYHCSDQHKFLQDVQVEDDLSMQTSNLPILADRYGVDPQDQDLIFYDAFYPSKAESSFEFSDEIDKYFDAMENDLPYDNISISENSEQTNPSSLHHSNIKVEGGKSLTDKAITELLHTNIGAGAVSALPVSDYEFKNKYEAIPALPDVVANKDSNTTIRSLLTNMLGSISGPPALAAEAHTSFGKYVGQMSGTYQVNELHVSPAMIHLQNTLQENGNAGLLLSYSLPDNNAGRKTSGLRPFRKIHELAVSLLLRGGCYPLFLSAFVLTVSYKVGMFIYDKN